MQDNYSILLILGILIIFVLATFLFKKFFNAKTFLIFSMVRSEKIVLVFDKFVFLKKYFNFISDVGLILGFGTIALDSMFFIKKEKKKRILYSVISFFA